MTRVRVGRVTRVSWSGFDARCTISTSRSREAPLHGPAESYWVTVRCRWLADGGRLERVGRAVTGPRPAMQRTPGSRVSRSWRTAPFAMRSDRPRACPRARRRCARLRAQRRGTSRARRAPGGVPSLPGACGRASQSGRGARQPAAGRRARASQARGARGEAGVGRLGPLSGARAVSGRSHPRPPRHRRAVPGVAWLLRWWIGRRRWRARRHTCSCAAHRGDVTAALTDPEPVARSREEPRTVMDGSRR